MLITSWFKWVACCSCLVLFVWLFILVANFVVVCLLYLCKLNFWHGYDLLYLVGLLSVCWGGVCFLGLGCWRVAGCFVLFALIVVRLLVVGFVVWGWWGLFVCLLGWFGVLLYFGVG